VWVGTERQGALVIGAEGGPPQPVLAPAGDGALAGQPVVALLEVRPGETWLGTVGGGIVAVDTASGRARQIRNLPALPASLADNVVRALYRDRSGLVWVATNRGLSRYDPGQLAVLTMFGTPVEAARAAAGAPGTDVASMGNTQISWILPVDDGRIWLGTHKGGVDIIDPDGARVAALAPDPAHPLTALPADMVLALAQAGDGSVYIGTKRGLYRASADGRRVRRIAIAGRDPAASTWALLVDGPRLWIGGQFDGLWQLDLRTGRTRPMLRGPGQALTDLRTTVLARDTGGRLWIGTRNGLNRYDPASGVLQRIPGDARRPDGLDAGFVATLYFDHQQRLWVGTYGGGIAILQGGVEEGRPRFLHLRTAQGLPDENVNSLIEDGAGQVWACTDGGLASIDPQTLAVRTLRRADGLLFPTYWTGSAARTARDELLFGGDGGMTIVRPRLRLAWTWRPPLVVTHLRIGGRPVPVGPYAAPAASAAAAPPPLQVPAAANSVSVEFAALDYSAPARNRYAYRLLGYDQDWIETDAAHRLASYTNLPPGDYTLQLRGSNRDGRWSQRDLALPLRVLPAWYQTLWARAAALLALLGLGAAVLRWRTRYLRAQQIALERKVGERTAMLEQVSRALAEKTRILEQTSVSDPLTGLRNRRFLAEHIDASIGASLRRSQEARLAGHPRPLDADTLFLLIDIDHFKGVNDRHGHAAGDTVLVQVAQRLHALMRDSDYVVRWGGEEFLAVARDTDRGRAEELAERVRDVIAGRPFRLEDGTPLALSASIGFACLPFVEPEPRALGWEEVVKLADLALFAAKRLGRNAWVGLHATPSAHAEGLLARLQAGPQRALDEGEVRLSSSHPAPAAQAALLARQEG
ncbi:MAG: diguanylate cyclase, partial [Burkholderiales bacterium]|nr:diguanylate cyclase [Burkholderiales bacterium]